MQRCMRIGAEPFCIPPMQGLTRHHVPQPPPFCAAAGTMKNARLSAPADTKARSIFRPIASLMPR